MYLNKTYEPVPKKKWGASDSSESTQRNRMRAVGKTTNSVGFTSLSHSNGELAKNALNRVRSSGSTVSKKVTNQNLLKPEPPQSLIATANNQRITVSYREGNIRGYPLFNYLYSFDGITFTEFVPPTTGTTVTFLGLTNGTPYTIYLKAMNRIGISVASEPVTATPFTIPNVPTSLSAVPLDGSIEITFVEPFNGGSAITDYEYSLNNGSTWSSSGDNSSPITISGLTNGTVYTIKLRARNIAGLGGPSSAISVAPIPINSFNPSTIAGLNLWLDGQDSSSVELSDNLVSTWNDRSGDYSEEYNNFSIFDGTITYAKPSGINNRPAIYFETAPSTYLYRTFNIAPTNELSLFMIVYHVSNEGGNSELFYSINPGYAYFDLFSNTNNPSGLLSINIGDTTQVSTDRDIRGSISLVDVIATSTADVYVNGTQTNNDIARGVLSLNNDIKWAISGGGFKGYIGEVITYPSGLSNIDRQRIEGYLAWKWGIQNNLPTNQPYKTAPPIVLDAPIITGITTGSRSLSVEFTQSNSGGLTITNYLYSTDNGTTFRALTTPDVTSPLTITTLSSNGTTLLTNGVTYSVIIQAKTVNGLSPLSNMVQETPAIPVPSTPTELSGVGGNQAAYILFTQSGTVTNYEYSTDNGITYAPFSPPQTYSPVMISGLTNGTTYTVKLKAVNSEGGISSESISTSVTPTVNSLNTTNLLVELDANNSSSYSGSGTSWTNLRSSGSYSATLQNGPSFNSVNKYFSFDGISQIADIAAASAINPTVGSSFTIQIWARTNALLGGDKGLISKQFGEDYDYDGYSLLLSNTGGVSLKMNGGGVDGTYDSSDGVYSNGWALYSIVVRFGSESPSYTYVSTRRVVTATNTEGSITYNEAPLQFPKGIQEGDSFCPADVGAFYLYDTAVSQEDIIRNYDATKTRYETDAIINSLSTSLSAYNAASTNDWVKITSTEYTNLQTNIASTIKVGISDSYLTSANGAGLTVTDQSAIIANTVSTNTLAIPANNYLYAFAVKYGNNPTTPATDLRVFTNTNSTSYTGFNQVGSILPSPTTGGSGFTINYYIRKGVTSTNGSTSGLLSIFTGQTSSSAVALSFYQNFSVNNSMKYLLFSPGATGGIPNSSSTLSGNISGYGAFAIQGLATPTKQWN
jgi:hypothetical protein